MLLAWFFRYLDSPRPRPRAKRRRAHARSVGSPLILQCLGTRIVPGFIAPMTYPVGRGPDYVAIGDFTGNGIQDFAVANMGDACDSCASDVSILLGNGDGTFGAARNFAVGVGPASVAVGDFNGDGIPDLAVANSAYYGGTPSVSILLGNGDGTFQAPRNFDVGPDPWSVAVGDFTGSGIQDLVVANDTPNGTVSVLLGNGDGTFRPAVTYAVGSFPESVAVGDFTGDGVLDLAVANYNNVSILRGNGDGTFQTTPVHYVAGTDPDFVAVGDFTGAGLPDLAVASYVLNDVSNDVSILLNDGNWSGPHPGVGRAPGRGAAKGLRRPSVVPLSLTPPSVSIAENRLPGSVAVSPPAPQETLLPSVPVRSLDQFFAGTAVEQPSVALWRPTARARARLDVWLTPESGGWPGF